MMLYNNNVIKQININLELLNNVIKVYKLAQKLHFINKN